MNTSVRTVATTEEFVRPRAGLASIKRYCDEMAEQERKADQFHTLLAVDSDVVHMAAFPVENLGLGSVFHAWGPLKSLSGEVQRATRKDDPTGRLTGIDQIFSTNAARIALLTTIALTEYIFRWRTPDDGLKSYAILPSHEFEWDHVRRQGHDLAARWHDSLPSRVRASDIRRIIEDKTDTGDIAGRLLDQMPETLSVLFPAQLRADHGDRTLHEMEISGVVARLEKFPHAISDFHEVISSTEAKFVEDSIFEFLFQDAMRSPALNRLSEKQRTQAVEPIKKAVSRDARVLTWLQQINLNPGNQKILELDGETKKLRAILITASARVWRAARQFGLAETCLRSPIAYLGEGRFFDWAFKDLISDDDLLFATLRRGKLSQWLEPLVGMTSNKPIQNQPPIVDQAYLSCVHEWERLMSHLATSLNLSSPTSGLQRAIAEATSGTGGRELVDELTALLTKKIVDASLQLSKNANVTGLHDPAGQNVLWRNLPPVMLNEYPGAEVILNSIQNDALANELVRNDLIEQIIRLETTVPQGQDEHIARDYLQTVLMSLLWMRMGQWGKARDVLKSAVGFALSVEDNRSYRAKVAVEHGDIRGDEALYLLAVTGRLAATGIDDLIEAHAALRLAEQLCVDAKDSPRFLAEEQSRGVAEMLFSPNMETLAAALSTVRLDLILNLFQGEPWQTLRAPWREEANSEPRGGTPITKLYSDSYALQQMYCAVLMRYVLAYPPVQDGRDDRGQKHRITLNAIFSEFERFTNACKPDQRSCVSDSTTTAQVRAAYFCWTDSAQRSGSAGMLLRTQFRQLLEEEGEIGASGLDRRRTKWIYRRLEKGWIA